MRIKGSRRARAKNSRTALTLGVLLGFAAPQMVSQSIAAKSPEVDRAAPAGDEAPLYERSSRWRCNVESKFLCFDDVCRRFAVTDKSVTGSEDRPRYWMELDFVEHTYTRCDHNGCDRKDVGTSTAGAFTLVEPGDGAFMKIANSDLEFVDVATMGTGVAASFGVCVPVDP
jgi:hypothetical protein